MRELVIAVDVGSSSARAGVFDVRGLLLARADASFATGHPQTDHAEHSSDEIWTAECDAVRGAITARTRTAPREKRIVMQSVWRDIAVVLDASPAGESVGRHAVDLAKRHQAHLVGIYGLSLEHYLPEDFVQGESAIRHVSERRRESEERKILVAGRRFAELSQDRGISSEFRVVWRDGFQNDAVLRALHCDLIVSTHPRPDDLPASWSAERLLLSTGTPVLLVPSSWSGQSIGETVMIAWNRSRESRRAVNDAMPFISTAGRVTILVVDGDGNPDYFGESPGANLFDHLSRHGAKADIARVSSDGAPIAEAISKQAIEHNADLLVLGAYSRPRMTEILFGGTTRSLLANAPLPLLISR